MYHAQHKPLYEAIGVPDNRRRTPTTVGRLIRRLLDAVPSEDRDHSLGTGRDKVSCFATDLTRDVSGEYPLHRYPHIAFGEGRRHTLRLFPDKLPIGVEKNGYQRRLFRCLATRPHPRDLSQSGDVGRSRPRQPRRCAVFRGLRNQL